jgi:pimeloyl-ACP methyl ester carboxylesterase
VAQIVLVHSPLVGASTWRPVAERLRGDGFDVAVPSLAGIGAAPEPRWRFAVERIARAASASADLVLVGHSGASLLLPAVTKVFADAVRAIVLVDAQVPPVSGTTRLAPPEFRAFLDRLAGPDGWLPRWSQWWGEGAMERLVPDDAERAELEADIEPLPLAYFDEEVPVPAGWDRCRVQYVLLSPACAADADVAAGRGWPVERIDGQHLDIATQPELIARLLAAATV